MQSQIPIETLTLFPVVDQLLIDLLKSLHPDDWNKQTVCKSWKIKDVVAHLLDGNIRGLSISRDHYFGTKAQINSHKELVDFINGQNMIWTDAAQRISPSILIDLLTLTNQQYYQHLKTLKPLDKAVFSVAWAGEQESFNWFHIAREYTEKFLHQLQIRDALNDHELYRKDLFFPFMHTLMQALPYTYRSILRPAGDSVRVTISSDAGSNWNLLKTELGWEFNEVINPTATIFLSPSIAWKLFTKSITPEYAKPYVEISGDKKLGEVALTMVSVMA